MSDESIDVVIVGASAAGLRCASRLARLRPDWRITVVEARETFSYAACGLPYVLSGDIADLEALHRTGRRRHPRRGLFRGRQGCRGARRLAGRGHRRGQTELLTVRDADGQREDPALGRTGPGHRRPAAAPARPAGTPARRDLPHARRRDSRCTRAWPRGKIGSAVVIGAGFLGCELAEAFTALWGAEVTLLEAAPSPLPGLLDPETGAIVARDAAGERRGPAPGRPGRALRAGRRRGHRPPGRRRDRDRRRGRGGHRRRAGGGTGRRRRDRAGSDRAPSPWTNGWPPPLPHVWAAGDVVETAARRDRRAGLGAPRLPGQPAGPHPGQHPGRPGGPLPAGGRRRRP